MTMSMLIFSSLLAAFSVAGGHCDLDLDERLPLQNNVDDKWLDDDDDDDKWLDDDDDDDDDADDDKLLRLDNWNASSALLLAAF